MANVADNMDLCLLMLQIPLHLSRFLFYFFAEKILRFVCIFGHLLFVTAGCTQVYITLSTLLEG